MANRPRTLTPLPAATALLAGLALSAPAASAQRVVELEPNDRPAPAAVQPAPNDAGDADLERQVDPEAQRILDEAERAWAELQTLTAQIRTGGTGGLGAFVPKALSDVLAKRDNNAWSLRATGSAENPMNRKETTFDTVWAGREVTWIDPEARTLTTAIRASGFAYQMSDAAKPIGLFGQRPFYPFETAAIVALEGVSELDGQTCDIVSYTDRANVESGSTRYRWHIARGDRLPRRIEQVVEGSALTGSLTWDLSNVRTGVNLPASAFEITAPAGYEVDDRTLAARPPRQPTGPGDNDRPNAPAPEGEGQPPRPNAQPDPNAVGPKPARIAAVERAPDFELESLHGGQVTLEDLRGKVVLLDFWGTWCLPCKQASPFIQELHEDYADKNVAVYALAFRSPDDKVREYFEDHKYTYGSLLQADDVVRAYKVRAFPTYVLLGVQGQELQRFEGGKPEETFAEIREAIDAYLAELKG